MPSTETGLVTLIEKRIAKAYPEAWIFKTVGNPYQQSGIPDLLICVEGRLFALEVKHRKPSESVEHALSRVTARQGYHLKKIREAGGFAAVVLDETEALEFIQANLDGLPDCCRPRLDLGST